MQEVCFTTKAQAYQLEELNAEDRALVEAAKKMTECSYSPYSHFRVGAAAMLENGLVIKGANQENAAYPSGLCAERVTLFAANANYPDVKVKSLAIACHSDGHFTSKPGAPCGACRQVMLETEHRYEGDMRVLLYGEDYTLVFNSARDLMPLGFFAEDLLG